MNKVISSFCSADKPQCVEVEALGNGDVFVTDSKHPDAEGVLFTRAEWVAFVEGVKAGEFDYDRLVEKAGIPLVRRLVGEVGSTGNSTGPRLRITAATGVSAATA
jgi:hypothetical protein